MYHYRKLKCLLLLMLVATAARAQLEDGNVYNFVNIENAGKSMTARTSGNYLTIATTDESDYSQLWYADEVETGVYTLRNLGNGKYLRSPNANGNAEWTCVKEVEDNAKFTWSKVNGNDVLRASNTTNGSHYLHYGSSTGTIVCWSTTAASQWTFTGVSVDAEVLADNWEVLESIDPSDADLTTFQTALNNLFTDKSCTELAKTFKSESEITADTDYNNLPTALQEMVMKVYNDSWTEDNGDKDDWDASYAKKYRVQLYEPHNEPEAAATALGINAHTNLNNPTGIYADTREALYVMVGGTIKEGASLYLVSYTGNGRLGWYGNGVELHEGLNVIPSFVDGNNYCINYVVHTFDTSDGKRGHKAKARKLSDYEDLKIHIEGGHINGYYNKMGDELYTADKNADWDYIEARATQTTVTILGEYITLQFPLNDAIDNGGNSNKGMSYYLNDLVNVEDVIEEWDNVMVWERLVLGLLSAEVMAAEDKISPYSEKNVFEYTGNDTEFPADYGDYYNVRGLSLGVDHNYMYGSWEYCGYHYNTMGGVIQNIPTNAGSHWGPGHEIGHQHQALLTVNGLMEVTNNLFSNVVLWYFGETTSRYNGDNGSLTNVLAQYNTEGADFFSNNIWAQTIMYYKLFLYYHVLGHNTKFYPRLFEMLRQDPMSGGYYQSGATSILHFYKKCCLAAGEDLTEFFRAHGFFEVMENRLVGDYSNSEYTQSQEDINAAIAEIKALKYEENIAVLFINDATGGTILSHKGDTLELYGETTICATSGSYATFAEDAASADYTCEISGNTVTMSGTGGVGFAIFNEDGELIGFSDKSTFEISSECAVAIMEGTAEIKAMNSDNTVEEIEYDEASVKAALLGGLLEDAAKILAMSDSENKKPGFYKSSALTAFQTAYNNAVEVYDSKVSASYSTAYETLYREYTAVKALTTDKVPFLAGSTYVLTNKKYPGYSMAINDKDTLHCYTTNLEDTKQQWTFEPTGAEDTYYLKNVSNSKYLRTLTKSGRCDALAADTDAACPYKLFDLGDGLWALQCQNDVENKMSLHCDEEYKTVGWFHTASDNDGSWWYLTATTLVETDLPRYELEDLITKTEALIDEVGYANNIQLQAIQPDSAFYLYCNALFNKSAGNNNGDNSMNTAKLLDGDPTTFIHTDYRTSSSTYVSDDALDHYLRVDMGEGNTVTNLQFTYTTRNAGDAQAHPKTIVVAGCNDLETEEFTTIVTLPQDGEDALPGANTNNDGRGVYTSPEIANDTPYRYIRFMVTETQGTGKSYGNHPYFYMAEFGLLMKDVTVDAKYADGITVAYLTEVFESLLSAQDVLATATTNEELKTAYSALEEKYNALLTKRNTVNNAAINTKKDELLTLIGETNTLIESCVTTMDYIAGTYNGTPKLQTTDSIANFYLWTNAQEADEGPIKNLIDGNNETYFHSDYSGDNSTDQLDHHITVNLGESNKASSFAFKYVTRHNTDANYPKTIKIWGSEDGETYEEIESVTNLPADQTLTYGPDTIAADKYYSYLRFMVTENNNNNSKGGHPIFHMAEFSLDIIGTPESYTIELGDNAGDAGEDILIATHAEMTAAQAVYDYATTESQVEAAISELTAAKEALSAAQQSNNKAPLRDLIAQTTALINECATVNYVDTPITTAVELKATETEGYAYLSCPNLYNPKNVTTNDNSDGDVDYNCEQLLDNNVDTYIHTNYKAATDTYPHYLQVAFGTSEVPAQFKFCYTTRSQGANQVPKHIRVEGSNDGTTFGNILGEYDFEDATNPLPTTAGASWTAAEYLTGGYAYLRFYVTESPQTNPYFSMSEFSMETYTPAGYDIDWNEEQRGNVTEEQLIAACEEINAANEVLRTSSVQSDIEAAQALLQEKYDVLYAAKNSLVEFTVQVEGGNANGGVIYNEVNYVADATFEAPINLTTESLTAIALDGYVAKSITIADRVVAVIYNKVYTVQVTGGGGNGGVTFGEQDYADDATFDAEQASFTAEDLTAIVPDGYTLKEVTVDHETGVISVSYAAIPLVDTTKYYTLACKATDHDTYIRDLGTSINGRSAEGSLFQFEAADEDNGYYIKSYVSEKYLNCTANDNTENDAVVESEEKLTVWKMAEPSHTDGVVTLTAGYDKYLNNNGDAPTYLLARYHSGGPGSSNACSLWTLTEGEPLDMSDLATLIEETNTLIESCYTDEEFNYSGSLNVTEDLMTATNEAVTAAQEKYDSKATTASEYEAVLAALQTAKDNLQTAINYAELPVQITFDANTPVTYKIAINRSSGAYILEYDNSTTMVAVTSKVLLGAKAQAWYFIAATDGKVYIMPYHDNNTTLALSTNDFSQGNSKVKAMEVGADGYTQAWTITANADNSGWYNITCTSDGTDIWYFSNHGGVGNKMGFYNDANDAGTLFKFEQVTIDKSEAYYALYNYYTNDVKLATGSIVGSEEVGYISTTLAEAYNTAYNNAATVLVSETATDDDYTSAYDALVAANDALVVNMPEEGKCYRLRSVARGTEESPEYAYVNSGDNKMYHSASRGADDATTIWSFTETGNGTYKLANLHTGTYMADNGWTLYQPLPLYGEAEDVEIVSLSGDGQVGIWCGDIMLHADGNGKVVRWEDGAGSGSAWHIVEVEDMSLVNFSLIVSQYLHAGLYLNYPVTIPDGVKAYIIDGTGIEIDADGVGTLMLTKMEGEVLPAGNGYILDAPAGDYDFCYTEDEATDDVSANMLGGSAYVTYREAETGHNYYVFGRKGDVVGLYNNPVKYDATGTEVEEGATATHYKVSANKVLFDWNNTSTQVSSFRFRVDDESTDIENVGVAEDMIIYDLCGRRIMEVKTSGLYIINGEKRYVEVR